MYKKIFKAGDKVPNEIVGNNNVWFGVDAEVTKNENGGFTIVSLDFKNASIKM